MVGQCEEGTWLCAEVGTVLKRGAIVLEEIRSRPCASSVEDHRAGAVSVIHERGPKSKRNEGGKQRQKHRVRETFSSGSNLLRH
jgi:hypothetical protein